MTARSEQTLRAVSDSLLADLDRLAALEEQKRLMQPDDPRVNEMAREVAEIAGRLHTKSLTQERITRAALEAAQRGDPGGPTHSIEETPRQMQSILDEWRAAERRLNAATPDSPEHAQASLDAERLRDEYRRGYDQRQGEAVQD